MSTAVEEPETLLGTSNQGEEVAADEQVVVFKIGEEPYAIDIARVQEIIRWQRITMIPKAPRFVEGIINLRGRVIPVVDLRRCFGLASLSQHGDKRIVVVDIHGGTVGLIVDGVSEVAHVPGSVIEPPSPIVTTFDSRYLRGIARMDDKLIVLLNLEQVLSAENGFEFART